MYLVLEQFVLLFFFVLLTILPSCIYFSHGIITITIVSWLNLLYRSGVVDYGVLFELTMLLIYISCIVSSKPLLVVVFSLSLLLSSQMQQFTRNHYATTVLNWVTHMQCSGGFIAPFGRWNITVGFVTAETPLNFLIGLAGAVVEVLSIVAVVHVRFVNMQTLVVSDSTIP